MHKLSSIILLSLFFCRIAGAQQTEIYHEPDLLYKKAVELLEKEKYSGARDFFNQYLLVPNGSINNRINGYYYKAVCSYELFRPDAAALFYSFIDEYPESLKNSLAHFYLARINYREKKYRNAIPHFEKTDIYYLNNDEIAEYYFKSGYCYFVKPDLEKASSRFNEIIRVESRYQTAAQYYYAHIAYVNDNYSTALESFKQLSSSESFGPLVPYYITQIYFEQKKYDELIEYARPLLESGSLENKKEVARLVAESYYIKGEYSKALSFFEQYKRESPTLSREDNYSIGYCYLKAGDYQQAVDHLQKVLNTEDSLMQNAYYQLAFCFMKLDNTQSARSAFQFASKNNFIPTVKEASLFNYAKLSFELNFQPVAVNAFRAYTKEYPNGKSIDEANELLARLYLTTHNYKDALAALENIKDKSTGAKAAFQKVAYYRGVEFYNDGNHDKAINMFEKAIVTDIDPVMRAQAMFWKAEALYAQNKFEAAVKQYRIYIFNPGSINTQMYNLANYNMGYCYFKLNNYDEAQVWFRKYLKDKVDDDKVRWDDANIRTADCFYAIRQFDNSLDFYNAAITNKSSSADYALFQKGIILGIQNNLSGKASTMELLLAQYPKSKFKPDALFELGKAAMSQGNNEKAYASFASLMRDHPRSNYNSKVMLNIGLMQYSEKDDEKALQTYKEVISKYPGTNEAAEALNGAKNIYVSIGKPDEYFSYVKTVPNASVSIGAQDSITYEAAEQRYMKGSAEEAAADFSSYLEHYPQGAFRINAVFYKAECDYRNKNYSSALTAYEEIIEQPKNIYTEKSLVKAGMIDFRDQKYDAAIIQFKKLEESADMLDNIITAQTGLMRCYDATGQHEQAITYAQKLIASGKASIEIVNEAHLLYGRSSLETNDLNSAQREMSFIAKQSGEVGAEAKYALALIQHKMQNYKTSKEKCFEVINAVPSYNYWIGKSFILLAENYIALKDTFQAKHTLKSIIDNFERDPSDKEDIRGIALQKLNDLLRNEKEGSMNLEEKAKAEKPEDDLSNEVKNQ